MAAILMKSPAKIAAKHPFAFGSTELISIVRSHTATPIKVQAPVWSTISQMKWASLHLFILKGISVNSVPGGHGTYGLGR